MYYRTLETNPGISLALQDHSRYESLFVAHVNTGQIASSLQTGCLSCLPRCWFRYQKVAVIVPGDVFSRAGCLGRGWRVYAASWYIKRKQRNARKKTLMDFLLFMKMYAHNAHIPIYCWLQILALTNWLTKIVVRLRQWCFLSYFSGEFKNVSRLLLLILHYISEAAFLHCILLIQ